MWLPNEKLPFFVFCNGHWKTNSKHFRTPETFEIQQSRQKHVTGATFFFMNKFLGESNSLNAKKLSIDIRSIQQPNTFRTAFLTSTPNLHSGLKENNTGKLVTQTLFRKESLNTNNRF